jgi:hypothetical protein
MKPPKNLSELRRTARPLDHLGADAEHVPVQRYISLAGIPLG